MRKDVKLVVAVACLVLIGLLSYVLFAPGHKKTATEVASDGAATDSAGGTSATRTETHEPTAPPVTVSLAPATQPTVSVSLAPATQPSAPTVAAPVVPATDSNVAVAPTGTAGGVTDWNATLSTGTVATAGGSRSSALPSNTLIGSAESPIGASTGNVFAGGPATRPSYSAATATGGAKTHKVAFGETLSSIAAEYYGNRANYTKIAAANPGINPNHLKVGTVLKIPDLKSSAAEAAASPAEKAASTSGNTYVVKGGDSLQKIATKLYGNSDKWQKIYEANRSTIGGDPHRLRAGLVLKLPEAPNSASAAVH